MARLACVNVAALPLQLLLRAHPDWATVPAAVVDADRPQALVRYVNSRAHGAGVRAGHRYATALAITRELRASTVPAPQIDQEVRALTDRLRRFSPHVEPAADRPGVFWLDAHGLGRLYPSLHVWAEEVRADLRGAGLMCSLAVGFSRFGSYALAIAQHETTVCADAADEHTRVQRVPLARLDLDPEVRDRLLALGISTVGGFLRLPAHGIRARFGASTDALYQLAAGYRWAPLVPAPLEERHEGVVDFDFPESNVERLVFVIKRLLDGLAAAIARRVQACAGVVLEMTLDNRTTRLERIRPAAPTLDVAQLLTLVRLRLDALQLPAGITTLCIRAETCAATADQQRLFAQHSHRDTDAAHRAFARVRAECGEQSVVRARVCDAHLPGARFTWDPLERMPARSAPRVVALRPLVRRIFERPMPLDGPAKAGHYDSQKAGHYDSQKAGHYDSQYVVSAFRRTVSGPYVLSGAWWGGGVHRDYYFVHTADGALQWIYYDRRRERFFLQGQVE